MSQLELKMSQALKKLLKSKGIQYQELAEKTGLSLPTIKRTLSKGEMTLARLEHICQVSMIPVDEVLKLVTSLREDKPDELSIEQEKFLAKNPSLFSYYDLLLNGLSPKKIETEFKLKLGQTTKILNALEKIQLLEHLGTYKIKLLTSNSIKLRRDGPLRALFKERCIDSFLNDSFLEQVSLQDFRTMRLSEAALRKFNHQVMELLNKLNQESEIEASTHQNTHSVGVFFASRRWHLSECFPFQDY